MPVFAGTIGSRSLKDVGALCHSLHPLIHLPMVGEMVTSSPFLTSFWLCTHGIFCIFHIRFWREHGLAPVRGTGPSLNQSCGQDDGDHPADSVKSHCLASCCRPVARVGTGLSRPTPATHPTPERCGMGFSCGEGIEGKQVTDIHYPGSATNWFRDFGSNNFSALSLSFFISKMEGLIRGFQNLLYL